jgi:Zn finger protein HypA/HybF involved in hydrogenase expression
MTPEMTSCTHNTLVLLPEKKSRLQCRHCHLTITSAELGDSFCPECYEIHDEKRYDFDEMGAEESGPVRYRCEECGVIIESE